MCLKKENLLRACIQIARQPLPIRGDELLEGYKMVYFTLNAILEELSLPPLATCMFPDNISLNDVRNKSWDNDEFDLSCIYSFCDSAVTNVIREYLGKIGCEVKELEAVMPYVEEVEDTAVDQEIAASRDQFNQFFSDIMDPHTLEYFGEIRWDECYSGIILPFRADYIDLFFEKGNTLKALDQKDREILEMVLESGVNAVHGLDTVIRTEVRGTNYILLHYYLSNDWGWADELGVGLQVLFAATAIKLAVEMEKEAAA